jgi:hypothetical protein
MSSPKGRKAAKKAWITIRAKQGIKPNGMSPQQWAWDERNPNGIRRNSNGLQKK